MQINVQVYVIPVQKMNVNNVQMQSYHNAITMMVIMKTYNNALIVYQYVQLANNYLTCSGSNRYAYNSCNCDWLYRIIRSLPIMYLTIVYLANQLKYIAQPVQIAIWYYYIQKFAQSNKLIHISIAT